jgi:hypothetical protein
MATASKAYSRWIVMTHARQSGQPRCQAALSNEGRCEAIPRRLPPAWHCWHCRPSPLRQPASQGLSLRVVVCEVHGDHARRASILRVSRSLRQAGARASLIVITLWQGQWGSGAVVKQRC